MDPVQAAAYWVAYGLGVVAALNYIVFTLIKMSDERRVARRAWQRRYEKSVRKHQ